MTQAEAFHAQAAKPETMNEARELLAAAGAKLDRANGKLKTEWYNFPDGSTTIAFPDSLFEGVCWGVVTVRDEGSSTLYGEWLGDRVSTPALYAEFRAARG